MPYVPKYGEIVLLHDINFLINKYGIEFFSRDLVIDRISIPTMMYSYFGKSYKARGIDHERFMIFIDKSDPNYQNYQAYEWVFPFACINKDELGIKESIENSIMKDFPQYSLLLSRLNHEEVLANKVYSMGDVFGNISLKEYALKATGNNEFANALDIFTKSVINRSVGS